MQLECEFNSFLWRGTNEWLALTVEVTLAGLGLGSSFAQIFRIQRCMGDWCRKRLNIRSRLRIGVKVQNL